MQLVWWVNPNAIVVGDEVFFPVILRSGFGDRMWTSLENFEFKVGGLTITDVRTPSRVQGGVEVPFVWSAGANAIDGMRAANLSIWLNPGDVPIQSERNHDISFAEGGGGQTYEFGEPLRTAGSELNVDINRIFKGLLLYQFPFLVAKFCSDSDAWFRFEFLQ